MNTKQSRMGLSIITVLFVMLPLFILFMQQRQETQQKAAGGFPHVVGTQIVDGNGNPLWLKGAMIESSFAYLNQWNHGEDPLQSLNPYAFAAMRSWGMNVVRINTSPWMYQMPNYMTKLDTAVQQANQAGLYVVLDFHDDRQSGSPYGDGANVIKQEDIDAWKFIAGHYASNPMIMFDVINEPKYTTPDQWLNGGGTIAGQTGKTATVLGYQDAVNAIRSVGAKQILIAASQGTATGIAINDPNIMYTHHIYQGIAADNPATWDAIWGKYLGKYPLYVGEWAVLADPFQPVHCQGVTSANADKLTNDFMNYMESRHINWSAWDFKQDKLIQNALPYSPSTLFTPTTFTIGQPWVCGDAIALHAGMGTDVKTFLYLHAEPSISQTPTPTNLRGTSFSITVCPHGLGDCGDNANPNGGGNTNPQHPTRSISLTFLTASNQVVGTAHGNVTYDTSQQKFTGYIPVASIYNS